jgi:hypothetical protein
LVVLGAYIAPAASAPTAYELRLPATKGDSGAVSLTIAPGAGHSVSRDGPLRIDVSAVPNAGLKLSATRLTRSDAADPEADAPRFELGYTAELPGGYAVAIEIRFWICRKRTCRPVRETRTVDVAVAEPAPPPPPDAGIAIDATTTK